MNMFIKLIHTQAISYGPGQAAAIAIIQRLQVVMLQHAPAAMLQAAMAATLTQLSLSPVLVRAGPGASAGASHCLSCTFSIHPLHPTCRCLSSCTVLLYCPPCPLCLFTLLLRPDICCAT